MNLTYKKIFFLSVGVLTVLVAAFAGVKINAHKTVNETDDIQDTSETIDIDTAKLRLFTKAGKAIDFNAKELSLSGTFSVRDYSDSSVNVNNAPYCFIKKDSSFYYRMNLTEMLNIHGYYILADGGQKKIMLSSEKHINPQMMLPQLEKLLTCLKEEKYSVSEMPAAEGFRKISLINPHHVTCKEYSITFNSKTFKPTEVFMRLSNLKDPLNTKMDKTISMKYSENNNLNGITMLSMERMVKKTDKGFKAVDAYSGYEVIDISQ